MPEASWGEGESSFLMKDTLVMAVTKGEAETAVMMGSMVSMALM